MLYPTIPGLDLSVHTIFCIGRNYEKHARELGNIAPSSPIVFIKPLNTLCFNGAQVPVPDLSDNVHHEAELVIAIGKDGKNIPVHKATDHIAGFGIGIDFTARDLQDTAKQKGHPWALCKGFDRFAPLGKFIPYRNQDLTDIDILLKVNNQVRQQGNTKDMIFSVPELIAYLSKQFTLSCGDLIFTGTPEGVSAVQAGDRVKASLDEYLSTVTVSIVK